VNGAVLALQPVFTRLTAFLALQSGRCVHRDTASSTLWPEVPEANAHASLRSALWRMARTDVPILGASGTHVWLDSSVHVDLWTANDRAETLLGLGSLGAGYVHLDQDLRLLSHDVLVGWFEDWALDEQERFRQLRLHALDHLGSLLLEAGRPGDAVRVGQVAVAGEPLRETAQSLLLRAHLAEGNLVEALRQYRVFAALFSAELGVQPSHGLSRIICDALDRAARADWSTRGDEARPAVRH
jgi:DNA-binding SARP family transcriptional activator